MLQDACCSLKMAVTPLRQWRYIFSGPVHAGVRNVNGRAQCSSDVCPLFGSFHFDRRGGVLLRCDDGGRYPPVSIWLPCPCRYWAPLTARPGDLVSRDRDHAGCLAGNGGRGRRNLAVQISALRRILDAGSEGASCIQTVIRARLPVCPSCDACTRRKSGSLGTSAVRPIQPNPLSQNGALVPGVVAEAAAPKRCFTAAGHERRRRSAASDPYRRRFGSGTLHDQAPAASRPRYSPQDRRQSSHRAAMREQQRRPRAGQRCPCRRQPRRDGQDCNGQDRKEGSTVPLRPRGGRPRYTGENRSTCAGIGARPRCAFRAHGQ